MKKNILEEIFAGMIASSMLLTACGTSSPGSTPSAAIESTSATTSTEASEAEASAPASAESSEESSSTRLPDFVYEGDDEILSACCSFTVDELAKGYLEGDTIIPCPIIIAVDDSNPEDILCYGIFDLYTYDLKGDTLETVSGGVNPGCFHISKNESGKLEVVDFDFVESGSDYDESAKKVFGEYYEKFSEISADSKSTEEIRKNFIKDYVTANNLPITKYKDYGWDAIDLF